jgi:hypothetical protein
MPVSAGLHPQRIYGYSAGFFRLRLQGAGDGQGVLNGFWEVGLVLKWCRGKGLSQYT